MIELHKKLHTEQEATDRKNLLDNFDNELTDLMMSYSFAADRIGGEFRSPGIKFQLNQMLKERKFY